MTKRNRRWEVVRDALIAEDPELREEYERMRPAYLVARELIGARARLGLSQAEVARRMGTSPSVISRIERMDTIPSLRTASSLAAALGLELELGFVPKGRVAGVVIDELSIVEASLAPMLENIEQSARDARRIVERAEEAARQIVGQADERATESERAPAS